MLDNGMRVYSKHDCVLQGYEGWPYTYAVISYFAYYDDAKLLPKLKLVYAEHDAADAPRNWMILTNEVHDQKMLYPAIGFRCQPLVEWERLKGVAANI